MERVLTKQLGTSVIRAGSTYCIAYTPQRSPTLVSNLETLQNGSGTVTSIFEGLLDTPTRVSGSKAVNSITTNGGTVILSCPDADPVEFPASIEVLFDLNDDASLSMNRTGSMRVIQKGAGGSGSTSNWFKVQETAWKTVGGYCVWSLEAVAD